MTTIDVRPPDSDILITEARRRARRRRLWSLFLVLALVAAAGGYWAFARGGSGPTKPAPSPSVAARHDSTPRPIVDTAALRGQGSLAFVSRGALWLASSRGGVRKLLPAARHPVHPMFSANGRWLAVATGHENRVWLARADGRDLHRLPAHGVSLDGWSPHGHTLAIDVRAAGAKTALTLVTPGQGQRLLARVAGDYGAVWSPSGHALAVAAIDQPAGQTSVRVYPRTGGHPTTWFTANNRHGRLNGMDELRLQPAGWWPGQGIGFWVYGNGMVSATDQTPLDVVRHPGAAPTLVANTLTGGTATAATASRDGDLAVVAQTARHGLGRLIWQDKRISVCPPRGATCSEVPAPGHTVTLDPAWSPDGHTLAYVVAPSRASPGFPQGVVHHWYAEHRLETYNAVTGVSRVVPHSAGATAPQWSADGRDLLYESHNGLWLSHGSSPPTRIAAPLFANGRWPAYYGQVDWVGQYAWSKSNGV